MLRKITLFSGLFLATPVSAHIGSHEVIAWWHWLTEPAPVLLLTAIAGLIAVKKFRSKS